jgi:selenocysteine-specific elongation factor
VHVIGTAGHVDHGKSALVAALTGTNPDRLAQELERGMTLDLGFAHLRFADGIEAGIVDVPGHERFLHNMLAGAAGMELLLLVVDACEGVMAQTLEHLAILAYLDVRRVIVVVNKIDLIDPPDRDAARRRIEEQLRETVAAGAPSFAVSATTGEGVKQLREALHRTLAGMPAPKANAPVYLPIDRAFLLTGLGTVVTGTLMQGSIAAGQTLRLEPGGKAAHVRSIGVFGSVRPRVEAGSRVALSLPGIDHNELYRGQAIVGAEFAAGDNFTVRFTPAAGVLPILRRRTPVRAYIGSAEVLGTLVVDQPFVERSETHARLHLREAVVAFPGVRFVVRRPSPMILLGGGYVEGAGLREAVELDNTEDALLLRILQERGLEPLELAEFCAAANLTESATVAGLNRLLERGDVIRLDKPLAYVAAAAARALLTRVLTNLIEAQRAEPWAMGATTIALSRALGVSENLLVRVLGHFASEGRLIIRHGYYATLEHEPALTLEQRAFFENLVPLDEGQPFVPIPFAGVAAAVRISRLTGASKAFETMLARGTLVKVGDDLYRGAQIGRIVTRVQTFLAANGRMTAAQFRDLLGTSRKYAVPLLEWLDAHGVTIRSGDYRTLRKAELRSK